MILRAKLTKGDCI